MNYNDYQNKENSFRSLTGLSLKQFKALFPYFKEAHDEYFSHYDMDGNYRNNRRIFTIYKNSPLPTVEDRLFFLYPILEESLVHADAMPAESRKKLAGATGRLPPEEG